MTYYNTVRPLHDHRSLVQDTAIRNTSHGHSLERNKNTRNVDYSIRAFQGVGIKGQQFRSCPVSPSQEVLISKLVYRKILEAIHCSESQTLAHNSNHGINSTCMGRTKVTNQDKSPHWQDAWFRRWFFSSLAADCMRWVISKPISASLQ